MSEAQVDTRVPAETVYVLWIRLSPPRPPNAKRRWGYYSVVVVTPENRLFRNPKEFGKSSRRTSSGWPYCGGRQKALRLAQQVATDRYIETAAWTEEPIEYLWQPNRLELEVLVVRWSFLERLTRQ